jgi:cell division protein FtsA
MQDIRAVLDIGSGYVKTIVIGEESGKITTLYKEIVVTKGIRKGKVLDPQEVTKTLINIIENIHKKLGGEYVDEYIVGLSHPSMRHERIVEQKRVMKEKIWYDDIKHLSTIVADISNHDLEETIKIVPVYWIIDEQEKVKDPIGIKASKLDIVADTFMIPKSFYDELIDIIKELNIYVADIIPNALATAEATLDYDMKDLGVMSIDIGKEQTTFIVYEEWQPIRYETLPLGGDAITKDISIGMQIDIREAETTKIENGYIGTEWEKNENAGLDAHFLEQIISARYEEILGKIQSKLESLGKEWRLAGGIVFSGGGSKVKNLAWLAKDIFKLAVFAAEDVNQISKDIQTNMQFINTLWLYNWSQKYANTRWWLWLGIQLGGDLIKGIGNFFKKMF